MGEMKDEKTKNKLNQTEVNAKVSELKMRKQKIN